MSFGKFLHSFLLVFVMFFSACDSEKSLVLNEIAPNIATMDLNGNNITLSDFSDKAIIMVFFKNGCEACVGILPSLDDFSKNNEKVEVLAINVSNTKDEIKELLEDMPLPNTHILRDSLHITENRFIINMTPTIILLDSSHIVRDKIIGADNFTAIKAKIERIL